ncbi:MAG: ABC transporter permease [Verrucomicrobiales bacterium]|nr:ABC transporter permease [Verrucomicrobiales bacterium]
MLALLWTRFAWRHWRMHAASTAMLMVIVALGVGVYFAVRLANRAAVASFQNFTDVLTSGSDGLIQAPAGYLPESVLPELRGLFDAAPIQILPVLESSAARPRGGESESIGTRESFTILGVDLIAVQSTAVERFGGRAAFQSPPGDVRSPAAPGAAVVGHLWTLLRDPRSVWMGAAAARRLGLSPGDSFPLVIQERIVPLRVAGVFPADPSRPEVPADLLVMDLPALQHWTDAAGRLSRVEFVVEDGASRDRVWADARARLVAAAERGAGAARWTVSTPGERRAGGEKMTRAFRLNLTILSLLALLVGLYLVFQALDGAVVRRREELAILRSLGVRPVDLRRAWMLEAVVLGCVGGVLGLALGWLGAQGAVRLIGRTVNALYYSSSASSASLSPGEAVVALAASVMVCVLAGWMPAAQAAVVPPAQLLSRKQGVHPEGPAVLRRPAWAGILAGLGALLCTLPPVRMDGGTRFPAAAYLAAFLWVFSAGILGAALLRGLARRFEFLGDRWASARVALSHLREPSGRHRLAVAGLVCAVAMTAGMAILVGSFDRTMRGWISRTFQADLYLSSDGAQSASTENRIRPATWRSVVTNAAVARAQVLQVARIQLPTAESMLMGCDLEFFRNHARPAWRSAPADDAVFDPDRNASLALVSEAFCERFQLGRGDRVDVPTPGGSRSLTIAGVYSDYGNERGSILVDRGRFSEWFGDELASSLILVLRPGISPEAVGAALRREHPGLAVFTQSRLRAEALRIFRQTFAITYALELIGVVVAVAGLGFTLTSLLWERRDSLATLRTLGFRRGELAVAAALEGLLTATAGITSGLVASGALGWLLIQRVNRQTFGWTLETHWPWGFLLGLAALVAGAAFLTAWTVGYRSGRIPAEREE